jgi:hypothetical protein
MLATPASKCESSRASEGIHYISKKSAGSIGGTVGSVAYSVPPGFWAAVEEPAPRSFQVRALANDVNERITEPIREALFADEFLTKPAANQRLTSYCAYAAARSGGYALCRNA